MLVLNRQIGEEIIINDNVIIKILSITFGRVSIGIEAPLDIAITRPDAKKQYKIKRGTRDE